MLSPTILKPHQLLGPLEGETACTSLSKVECCCLSSQRGETTDEGQLASGEKQGAATLSSLQVETTPSELCSSSDPVGEESCDYMHLCALSKPIRNPWVMPSSRYCTKDLSGWWASSFCHCAWINRVVTVQARGGSERGGSYASLNFKKVCSVLVQSKALSK